MGAIKRVAQALNTLVIGAWTLGFLQDASNSNPATFSPPDEEFVRLFTRYQRPLFLYLLTRVPNPVEAEEILQETNIVIWRKFAHFTPGTNFLAWASQIAKYELLKYRERNHKDKLNSATASWSSLPRRTRTTANIGKSAGRR